MLIVKAGVYPHPITRSCSDPQDADDWVGQCTRSGLAPVMVRGLPLAIRSLDQTRLSDARPAELGRLMAPAAPALASPTLERPQPDPSGC